MLAAWGLAGRTVALPTYLSRPTAISAAIVELTQSGELHQGLVVSLIRAYVGFALGASLGVIAGLAARDDAHQSAVSSIR